MILAIFGSRSIDSEKAKDIIEREIISLSKNNTIDYIAVPGGIQGACKLATEIAEKMRITTKVFYYRKSEGNVKALTSIDERTNKIVQEADFFLAFHDGISKGTMKDIKKVKKAGKPYKYILINQNDFDVRIQIDTDITGGILL